MFLLSDQTFKVNFLSMSYFDLKPFSNVLSCESITSLVTEDSIPGMLRMLYMLLLWLNLIAEACVSTNKPWCLECGQTSCTEGNATVKLNTSTAIQFYSHIPSGGEDGGSTPHGDQSSVQTHLCLAACCFTMDFNNWATMCNIIVMQFRMTCNLGNLR